MSLACFVLLVALVVVVVVVVWKENPLEGFVVVVVWKENPVDGLGFEKLNPPPGFELVQSILLSSVEDAKMGEED